MLKRVVIQDRNYKDMQSYVVDTKLSNNISIIKKVLDIDMNSEYCRDFTEDTYFNQVEWKYEHYYIEDVEIYKI